ncbi:MAG: protein-glutamate O-methyltransferase CheR [Coriobacteriia bacterium]|nr:protein-glutamate O-methyltransferase CheR [Coriobacteriia bacterium]
MVQQEQSGDVIFRGSLQRLLNKLLADRGIDLSQYRPRYVERRVAVRLNAVGTRTYDEYAAYLDWHPEEYAKLLDTLTVNVTQFFRDAPTYAVIRNEVVPTVLKTKISRKQRLIRVWSAGCATGEEPYSLAMLFLDGIRTLKAESMLLTVIGTDVDEKAIKTAKLGQYPAKQLAQISATDRHRYVESNGDFFQMTPEVRKVVRFQHSNLFDSAPIIGIDVVVCRNVFIYLNHEDQERMITTFWRSLNRGGFLVLGRSERLPPALADQFELVNGRERVYRKPLSL